MVSHADSQDGGGAAAWSLALVEPEDHSPPARTTKIHMSGVWDDDGPSGACGKRPARPRPDGQHRQTMTSAWAEVTCDGCLLLKPADDVVEAEAGTFGLLPLCEVETLGEPECHALATNFCARCGVLTCEEHGEDLDTANGPLHWCTECAADLRFAASGLRAFLTGRRFGR